MVDQQDLEPWRKFFSSSALACANPKLWDFILRRFSSPFFPALKTDYFPFGQYSATTSC